MTRRMGKGNPNRHSGDASANVLADICCTPPSSQLVGFRDVGLMWVPFTKKLQYVTRASSGSMRDLVDPGHPSSFGLHRSTRASINRLGHMFLLPPRVAVGVSPIDLGDLSAISNALQKGGNSRSDPG
jgi:hypothetical protein